VLSDFFRDSLASQDNTCSTFAVPDKRKWFPCQVELRLKSIHDVTSRFDNLVGRRKNATDVVFD